MFASCLILWLWIIGKLSEDDGVAAAGLVLAALSGLIDLTLTVFKFEYSYTGGDYGAEAKLTCFTILAARDFLLSSTSSRIALHSLGI